MAPPSSTFQPSSPTKCHPASYRSGKRILGNLSSVPTWRQGWFQLDNRPSSRKDRIQGPLFIPFFKSVCNGKYPHPCFLFFFTSQMTTFESHLPEGADIIPSLAVLMRKSSASSAVKTNIHRRQHPQTTVSIKCWLYIQNWAGVFVESGPIRDRFH